MKFALQADGDIIEAEIDDDGHGGISGVMHFSGYRDAQITGTSKAGTIDGAVNMEGHSASFHAVIADKTISGRLSVPFPLSVLFRSRSFTGIQIA